VSLDPYLFFRTPPFLERVTHVDHLVSDITRFFDAFVSDGAVHLEAHRPVRESGSPPDTDHDLVAEFALATLPGVSPGSMICPSMLENTWLKKAAGGGEGAGISRTRDERKTVASTHLYSQAGAREGDMALNAIGMMVPGSPMSAMCIVGAGDI
jgi:hypothetical protein